MITKQFVLAGKAIFTLEIPATYQQAASTRPHYTYRVKHKEADGQFDDTWFVSLLTGPDNTSDYTYVGLLLPHDGGLKLTKKSQFTDDTPPVKLFRRTLARLWANEQAAIEAAGFKLHHEGRCGRCGRVLTVPESVESGFGPECIGKI